MAGTGRSHREVRLGKLITRIDLLGTCAGVPYRS